MGLLKFLFITILVFYIIRFLIRLIFPVVVKSVFGKMQQQANQAAQNHNNQPEGSISINHIPKQAKKGNADKLGDFVDYEEVK